MNESTENSKVENPEIKIIQKKIMDDLLKIKGKPLNMGEAATIRAIYYDVLKTVPEKYIKIQKNYLYSKVISGFFERRFGYYFKHQIPDLREDTNDEIRNENQKRKDEMKNILPIGSLDGLSLIELRKLWQKLELESELI